MTATFASPEWVEELREACNDSEGFKRATAFADTRLALMIGPHRYLWKLYKGAIIDSYPFVLSFDPLGYDVVVRAELDVWTSIATRKSKVWDHYNGMQLEIGGNHLEAHRLHESILILCQDVLPSIPAAGLD